MKDSSKKHLNVVVQKQIGLLSRATGRVSMKMRKYVTGMAATWAEKVKALRGSQACNRPTVIGLRIASKGLSIFSRLHGGPSVDLMETADAATSLEPAGLLRN